MTPQASFAFGKQNTKKGSCHHCFRFHKFLRVIPTPIIQKWGKIINHTVNVVKIFVAPIVQYLAGQVGSGRPSDSYPHIGYPFSEKLVLFYRTASCWLRFCSSLRDFLKHLYLKSLRPATTHRPSCLVPSMKSVFLNIGK